MRSYRLLLTSVTVLHSSSANSIIAQAHLTREYGKIDSNNENLPLFLLWIIFQSLMSSFDTSLSASLPPSDLHD